MTDEKTHTAASRPFHRSRDHPQAPSLLREVRSLLAKIAVIGILFLLLFTFLFGLYRTADHAMAPAIRDGDLVLFYRLDKSYAAGDTLLLQVQGEKQVRRVIAAAGDTVDITQEGLVINGALQQEPQIYQQTQRYAPGTAFPLTVGEGQVFVLGDARESAADSRIYGTVEITDTLGKAIALLRQRNL